MQQKKSQPYQISEKVRRRKSLSKATISLSRPTALRFKFTVRQAEARAVKEVELFVDVAPE